MKLKNVTISKYTCIQTEQSFEIEDDVTILVGMNESGKTSVLKALSKSNYFQKDKNFEFNLTHDFPRKEKKKVDKSGETPNALKCHFEFSKETILEIENDLGKGVLLSSGLDVTSNYLNKDSWSVVKIDNKAFIENQTKTLGISSKALNEKLLKVKSIEDLDTLIGEYTEEKYTENLEKLREYFLNTWEWSNSPLSEYITRKYLKPNRPKFLYYDEYFSLPSRINIEQLLNEELEGYEYKTAKALFELADINTDEILESEDFEDFIAELEATESIISDELFKYWRTNKNLSITFRIDKKNSTEHILDIRVKHKGISLPLKNRSKGFNWFFSFLVWFKKIQEDKNSNYILLLDEPGLNLHASAQADLLMFIEDLAQDYQVIYTTHSPFMIPDKLDRVRTVLETDDGSIISDSLQEKDPNTLFPLQAALGYDIAQNLFISKNNLLVEGVSDLVYLQTMSTILESNEREGLRDDVTIVPTGGLDKVGTFISLLRGSELNLVCLLDTFNDVKGKAKVDKLIKEKIIENSKVRFFDEFLDSHEKADLEDLFTKSDYLKMFNAAFHEHMDIKINELKDEIKPIIIQLNKHLGVSRFNHYRPANILVKLGADIEFYDAQTLDNFENVFKVINKLFK